jgi:hypothetical protein
MIAKEPKVVRLGHKFAASPNIEVMTAIDTILAAIF